MSNIHTQKLKLLSISEKKRKHFRFVIKNEIKLLSENNFIQLNIECLHYNHYPLLEEYLRIGNTLHELCFNKINTLQDSCIIRKEITDLKYLYKSHRKTLTCLLTELVPDGYTSDTAEWFLLRDIFKK